MSKGTIAFPIADGVEDLEYHVTRMRLEEDGFKVVNTGGKYDLSMKKVVTDAKGKINTFIVDSQEDPTVFSMRRIKTIKLTTRKTIDGGEIKIGTTTNCNDIVKFANEPTKFDW